MEVAHMISLTQQFLRKPLLPWGVSGVLTGLSLLFSQTWILVFLGLLLQLRLFSRAASAREVLVGATLAGFVHMLVVQLWGWEMVSLAPLGVSPLAQSIIIFYGWLFSSFLIGFGYGVGLWLVRYITVHHWSSFVLFPVGILSGELIGRLLFSLGSIGLDTGLTVAYGFGHVGYALIEHEILRIGAILGGVYSLTLIVGVCVVFVYVSISEKKYQWFGIGFFVMLFLTSFAPVDFRKNASLPNDVALVSTVFTMEHNESYSGSDISQASYRDIFDEVIEQEYSTVILPEDSRFLSAQGTEDREVVLQTLREEKITLIESTRAQYEGKTVLRAETYDATTNQRYEYDKQYLVPFGEQIPLLASIFLRSIGFGTVVDMLNQNFGYRTGIAKSETEFSPEVPVTLFCYESIVPYAVRQLRENETPYVAHVVSHAWFDDRLGILQHQLSAMLRVQAIWNNLHILQAANIIPAAVYTSAGDAFIAPSVDKEGVWRVDAVVDIVARNER